MTAPANSGQQQQSRPATAPGAGGGMMPTKISSLPPTAGVARTGFSSSAGVKTSMSNNFNSFVKTSAVPPSSIAGGGGGGMPAKKMTQMPSNNTAPKPSAAAHLQQQQQQQRPPNSAASAGKAMPVTAQNLAKVGGAGPTSRAALQLAKPSVTAAAAGARGGGGGNKNKKRAASSSSDSSDSSSGSGSSSSGSSSSGSYSSSSGSSGSSGSSFSSSSSSSGSDAAWDEEGKKVTKKKKAAVGEKKVSKPKAPKPKKAKIVKQKKEKKAARVTSSGGGGGGGGRRRRRGRDEDDDDDDLAALGGASSRVKSFAEWHSDDDENDQNLYALALHRGWYVPPNDDEAAAGNDAAIKAEVAEKAPPRPKVKRPPGNFDEALKKLSTRFDTHESKIRAKDESKEVSLGTSKTNYIDPRVSVAWAMKMNVPVSKIFNKTLLDKFSWATAELEDEPEYHF